MTKKVIGMALILSSLNLMADSLPTAPKNFGAYNFTGTTARLSFQDFSNNEIGFRVYHNDNIIATAQAKNGIGKYQYINLHNLNSCTLYTVAIVAYNDSGESNRNRIKSFRTKDCGSTTTTINHAPVAKAGTNKSVVLGNSITLIGTGTDSDGTIVSYTWKRGTTILATTATLTYTPTSVGVDKLTLIVTDNKGAIGSDSLDITVSPNNNNNDNNDDNNDVEPPSTAPLAPKNIGAYNFSNSTARLSFKDLADNEDGFKVYYNGNKIANIGAKDGVGNYQYINVVGLEACKLYNIQLVAYNNGGESAKVSKSFKTIGCDTIQPKNHIPTVNAGANKSVLLGDTVNIIGIASDKDGHIQTYVWKKGTQILSNTATLAYETTTKGIDTLTLSVTDNDGATASDTVRIFVNDPEDIEENNTTAIDITLFGAIPNDNIDDTEAISNALAVSGKITMPTGVYNVKNLKRFGTTIIEGNGSTFKTERSVFATSNNILTLKTELDSDRILIKNLILDGSCPTQYPTVGEHIISLLHIYDSKNIILEGIFVKDYSSQFPTYNKEKGDLPAHQQMNLDHSLDNHYTILITFSRDIIIRNMEQENIKIEGPLIYESDNILIENFKSKNSNAIWTALHVVASDNIIMKNVVVSDGLVSNSGSSINFFANHYFSISDVNTTNKNGFDISNEVIDVPTGRVLRDTSYGTFTNCRFQAYHPLQAYPTKVRHEALSFFNTQFIPSRVEHGANAIRFEKAGELLFDNCTFGSSTIMTNYPMILGDTQKITIKNSTFLNTSNNPSIETGSIYFYGGEYGDINITDSSFTGVNYTPLIFRRVFKQSSTGRVESLRFINNTITNETELIDNSIYKTYDLRVNNVLIN